MALCHLFFFFCVPVVWRVVLCRDLLCDVCDELFYVVLCCVTLCCSVLRCVVFCVMMCFVVSFRV